MDAMQRLGLAATAVATQLNGLVQLQHPGAAEQMAALTDALGTATENNKKALAYRADCDAYIVLAEGQALRGERVDEYSAQDATGAYVKARVAAIKTMNEALASANAWLSNQVAISGVDEALTN